ncbi:hypothetical protein F5Y10DRAFT_199658 [Nemania abortiva]|nr:hypothetical protein F5Y10DRAFT_199658 [Nemania abortiva]
MLSALSYWFGGLPFALLLFCMIVHMFSCSLSFPCRVFLGGCSLMCPSPPLLNWARMPSCLHVVTLDYYQV